MLTLRRRANGYWTLIGIVMVVFLMIYGVVEALHVPYLSGTPQLSVASVPTALLIIGLLVADVLLPVPSSLVMAAGGALFGFWIGAVVSLVGNVLGFVFAYWLGYRSSSIIQKAISLEEMERGNQMLRKWGMVALVLTRPLPILAETTAIMAGVARLSRVRSIAVVTVSAVPVTVLYAWAGSRAQGFTATIYVFVALIFVSAVVWKIDKGLQRKKLTSLIRVQRPRQKRQIG